MMELSYRRHRFPPVVIQHAVWLYLRFTLSCRDVEESPRRARARHFPRCYRPLRRLARPRDRSTKERPIDSAILGKSDCPPKPLLTRMATVYTT